MLAVFHTCMGDVLKGFFDFVRERWASRLTPWLLAPGVFYATLWIVSETDFSAVGRQHLVAAGVVAALAVVLWIFTTFAPRTPRGKVGVILSVQADNEEHALRLRADFTRVLESLLQPAVKTRSFAVVEYPQFIARRVRTHDDAHRYLRRSRGRLMLFGRARVRHVNNAPVHVLELQGAAIGEGTVPKNVQQAVQAECHGLLPRQIHIQAANDLFEFQLTSEFVEMIARYSLGLVALASTDILFAEELLLGAKRRADTLKRHSPIAKRVANRVPGLLVDLWQEHLRVLAEAYYLKRTEDVLEEKEMVALKILGIVPRHYGALLSLAMCAFLLRRDLIAAYRALKLCAGIHDAAWRYSQAFLLAYEGKLGDARRTYREAFKVPCGDPSVPVQCEEFIDIVLGAEPSQVQLLFCQGLINFYAKKDLVAARRDLTSFIERVDRHRFTAAQSEAKSLLSEIDALAT